MFCCGQSGGTNFRGDRLMYDRSLYGLSTLYVTHVILDTRLSRFSTCNMGLGTRLEDKIDNGDRRHDD